MKFALSALSPLSALSTLHTRLPVAWQKLRQPQFLQQRRQRWVGVDLQADALHVAVLAADAPGERVRVLECRALPLNEALSADALASFAHELHSHPQRWSLLLARDDYRISIVPAPEVPASEQAESLRWQLASSLDFAADDASIASMALPTAAWEAERPAELYAIAARGETVAARAALFRDAQLPLSAIDIRETAQRNIAALMEHEQELLVMVAFTHHEVQITFNWHGELYLDRLIAEFSSPDDTPDRRAALCDRIALQVQRSLTAVRNTYPFMQSARIVVAGAPPGFCEALAELAPAVHAPIETLQPDTFFDFSLAPELRAPEQFMRYFHALGCALRGRGNDT